MIAALGFLRSPLGMAVVGAVVLVIYTGFIWTKATGAANDRWKVKLAVATEQTRQKAAARARRVEEALRVQVDVQSRARTAAEQKSQELRNAILADKSDPTVAVGSDTDLDRLLRSGLYPRSGDGTSKTRSTGQP